MGRFISLLVLAILQSNLSETKLQPVYKTELLPNLKNAANRVVRITSNFDFHVQFYYEDTVNILLIEYLMEQFTQCYVPYVAVRFKNDKTLIREIDDDHKLMYALIVIKGASKPLNLSPVRLNSGEKHRSFFIIFVEQSRNITKSWLQYVFEEFWKKWVLNVIIVYWTDSFHICTYNPFEEKLIVELPSHAVNKNELFPFIKLPNMNKHELKIALFPEPIRAIFEMRGIRGIDGSMASMVPHILNATGTLIKPFININGQIYPNGSADGNIRLIIEKEIDIAMNSRFLLYGQFKGIIETTHVLERDDICILVPRAEYVSLLFNIFRVFSMPLWAMVFTTFIFVLVFLKLTVPHTPNMLLKIYCWFLNNNTTHFQMKTPIKGFIGLWLLYSLLITSSYKGNLTSHLMAPISLPQINTLRQLAESNYQIVAIDKHARLIREAFNESKPVEYKILKKISVIPEKLLDERIKINDRSVAFVNKHHVLHYVWNSRAHVTRNSRVYHVMDECPAPFESIYVVPYGSPYLGFFNVIVRRTQEHGLALYWINMQKLQRKISRQVVMSNDNSDPVVLKTEHLQAAFCLLGLGLFASFCAFVCESICYKKTVLKKVFKVKPSEPNPPFYFTP